MVSFLSWGQQEHHMLSLLSPAIWLGFVGSPAALQFSGHHGVKVCVHVCAPSDLCALCCSVDCIRGRGNVVSWSLGRHCTVNEFYLTCAAAVSAWEEI